MSASVPSKGQHLHFDCVSGIAGDMTLGAMLDLGVPSEILHEAMDAVGLGRDRLQVEQIVKSGIASTNVTVRCPENSTTDHAHYHYSDIRQRILTSTLRPSAIKLACNMFEKLAEAEGKLHGVPVDKVAFHEVGAVDSIADVVGSAVALDWLSPASVSASVVAMGRGSIHCAHGVLPVPSPAALEILRQASAPVCDGDSREELCTPTGAAILASVVTQWGTMPNLVPTFVGYGAGDKDLPDRPNVLRLVLGRPHNTLQGDRVVVAEANIDDMNPELCQHVTDLLLNAGALDVWWTAIIMKKGRPALALHAMCTPSDRDRVSDLILLETTTIGVRHSEYSRRVLDRELVEVTTELGSVTVKVASNRGQIINISPEYNSCVKLAKRHNVPLKTVFLLAQNAYQSKVSS